jgi:hypothetical protein
MFSRFDTEARIAVAQATDIARELGHGEVGPDHLLLGLLANMRGPAYAALSNHGLRLEPARDLVVTQHTEPDVDVDVDVDVEATDQRDQSDGSDGLDEDREALRAIGIDLDRVREAVRENLGADLTDGWGSRRPARGRRGRGRPERAERRRGRRHQLHHHGRGRRGPQSRRDDYVGFSARLRDLLRDVRRASLRDRLDRDADVRDRAAGMTGPRLALALLESDDPVVRAVLATATDIDGLRARLEAAVTPAPAA